MEKINGSVAFFMGANTPEGFYSFFDALYPETIPEKLYIIKGGPGTGKSTFMKKIAGEAESRGLYCERIYCSSDPVSLDAVIIPSLNVRIADGTAPHVLEPKIPGVFENIIDFGMFRDDKLLSADSQRIISLTKACSEEHKKCAGFLKAAGCVGKDTDRIVQDSLNTEKIKRFAQKLSQTEITVASSDSAKISYRFLSAPTSLGQTVFFETAGNICERRIILEDNFGAASSLILDTVFDYAVKAGADMIVCPCPMNPSGKKEHIIFPSLSLGIFTSNRFHPCTLSAVKTVRCRRFSEDNMLKRRRNRLIFNRRAQDELIREALSRLETAKELHDRLEQIYIGAMDFDSLNVFMAAFTHELFSRV